MTKLNGNAKTKAFIINQGVKMENSVLQEIIRTYATKYEISSVLSSLQALKEQQSVKIGFLGAYSAGKTSLINSILGLNLPTDISATTKSICMIEPTPGVEKNEYYMDDGQSLEKISISDFYSIVDGSKDGLAVIKTKPSSVLPEGSVFVDTPGIDSVGSEIEQTFAYLQYVDAAVFCIKSLNGTINHNILEFLSRPEIQSISNHIVFALTHQDKIENEEAVRQEVIKQLRNLGNKFKINNLEEKIFFVNAKDGVENADLVYSFVKKHIFDDLDYLSEKRTNHNLVQIASQLKSHLEKILANKKLNDSEINKRQEEIEKCISELESKIEAHRYSLTTLQQELQNEIFNHLESWKKAVATANSTELKGQVDAMLQSLVNNIDAKIKLLLPNFDIPATVKGAIGAEITAAMTSIDKSKDALVTVSTAALTAWLLPGASTAANAVEAAGGAAAKTAGDAAAKAGTSSIKKFAENANKKLSEVLGKTTGEAAKSVGKESVKQVGKQTVQEASKFAKFLGIIGTAIKEANPLEHVGTFFADRVKESSFEDIIANYSTTMARNVVSSLSDSFELEIVRPLQQNLNDQKRALDAEEEKRIKGYKQFNEERIELEDAIKKLSNIN